MQRTSISQMNVIIILNEHIQEDNRDSTSIIPIKYIIASQTAALELLR